MKGPQDSSGVPDMNRAATLFEHEAEMTTTTEPLYSCGTWDADLQAYTPQRGLTVPCVNVPLATMRQAVRELRSMGYSCHRVRDSDGSHEVNDWSVLIERTDGKPFDGQR